MPARRSPTLTVDLWAALMAIGIVVGVLVGPACAQDHVSPSPLERPYSERAGTALRLVGYGIFADAVGTAPRPAVPVGEVPDDLVLGPGDVLSIVMDGDRRGILRVPVDTAGTIAVPDLGVLPAAGRELDAVRRDLRAAAASRAIATEVHVTLARLRQMTVLVGGAVADPGRRQVGALSGVLDALIAAGGVNRAGSLRRVRLIRGGEATEVDVFTAIEGGGADPRLRDGDRVVVPALGPTAAVAGAVKRPGVFELPADGATVGDLLALGGGPLPGGPRLTLYRYDTDGRIAARGLAADDHAEPLADGDLIIAEQRPSGIAATVALEGHVQAPGRVPLAEAPDLRALLEGGLALKPDAYPLFGAIETTAPATGGRTLRPFSPDAVIAGREDRALAAGDRVIVLSAEDVAFLGSNGVVDALNGLAPPPIETLACPGLARLDRAVRGGRGPVAGAMLEAAAALPPLSLPCPAVFRRHPDLLTMALMHSVLVTDGAARPGLYPVADWMPVASLATLAGVGSGSARDARVLTGDGAAVVGPGDIVAIETPAVVLEGAVRAPGRRPLSAGAGLAEVLAGGSMPTAEAYPLIAIIERSPPGTMQVERLAVAPAAVVAGRDVSLQDRDRIRLFHRAEIDALASDREADPPETEPMPMPVTMASTSGPALDEAMVSVLRAHGVAVTGAVARPGLWPVAGPTSAAALVDAAGGLLPGARVEAAEATVVGDTGTAETEVRRVRLDLGARGLEGVILRPGDALHIPPRRDPVAGRSVEIAGAVRHPGTYTLVEGDRLSSLIERAGGLTADAYPLGAVFTREAEATARQGWLRGRAREIRRALAEAMTADDPPDAAAVQAVETLIAELVAAEPPGRLQVEADPERLRADPSLDIVLQDGDRLVVPVRPLTVRVTGEVLSPGAVQFRDGRRVGDYLRAAGGLTHAADGGRVFVVLPDGRAQPVRPTAWTHAPVVVPPGSTIVVPRDPAPFRFLDLADTLGQVFSNLALGTAALITIAE